MRAVRAAHQAFALHQVHATPDAKSVSVKSRGASNGKDLYQRLSSMEDILVSSVRAETGYGQITIFDLPDQPGNCSRVFQSVASGGINVDMIVQNLGNNGRAELSFSVPRDDFTRALKRTQDVVLQIDPTARVSGDSDIGVLFVFGVGMRTHTGVARKMFGALAERGINIRMINTSEVCISVVVEKSRGEEALSALKKTFEVS
jgi:aspartate kinase